MIKRKPQVSQKDIKLISTKGTKGRGGDKGGEAWRIDWNNKRAGIIYINLNKDTSIGKHASMSIFLNLPSQGRGIGTFAIKQACQKSKYNTIYAHIRKSNIASSKAFEKAGFIDKILEKGKQKLMVWKRNKHTSLENLINEMFQ